MKKIIIHILVLSVALGIICGNFSAFAANETIYGDVGNESNTISEDDIIDLLEFINEYSYLMDEGYDYKFANYDYVVQVACALVLSMNNESYVNMIEKETPDPLNMLEFTGYDRYYYEIDGEIVDWYIRNIFNTEPDYNFVGTKYGYVKNYYNDGKYYYIFDSNVLDMWGFFEDISCQRLNDGRYYIKFVDKESGDVKKYVLAELIEKEDKKYWGFYNISNNPVLLAEYNLDENSSPINFQLSGDKVRLRINDTEINIEDEENLPVVYGGNIYIPVHGIADILNIGVINKYHDGLEYQLTVNISTDNSICENSAGSRNLYIDNKSVIRYKNSSHTINGKYLMPVQMFFTVLGGVDGSYEWNKEENYVNIIAPNFSFNEKLTEIKAKYTMADEKNNYIEEAFEISDEYYGTVYKNPKTNMIEKIDINKYFSRYTSEYIDLYFDNNKIYYYSKESYDNVTDGVSKIKCYFDDGKLVRYEGDVMTVWDESLIPENYDGYFNCFRPATIEERENSVLGDICTYWKDIVGSEYER